MPSIKTFSLKKAKLPNPHTDFKSCTVHLLDENQQALIINLKGNYLGFSLLDDVFLNIGKIIEKDYFGLRYIDSHDQKQWLKLEKIVVKELKKAKTNVLYFGVKYYPGNPSVDFIQDLSRYQLYLQLRKNLYEECLIVKEDLLPRLISLVIQGEIGDTVLPTPENILRAINNLKIYKNVSADTVKTICEIVETLNGFDSSEMENQFVDLISQLESYGVEPNSVYDNDGEKLFLAMNHQGICTFVGEKRTQMFYWENISKMIYISKIFKFEINTDNRKEKFQFKFQTENAASAFWIWATDRQYFMTLNSSTEAKKVKSNSNIFRRKIKHRFSGRSKKEVTESCQTLLHISQPPIIRTRNSVVMSRSNSAKAVFRESMNMDDDMKVGTYATMPRRSNVNNPISVVSIDFQQTKNDGNKDEVESENSSILEDFCLVTDNQKTESLDKQDLPDIFENKIVEVIESCQILADESVPQVDEACYTQNFEIIESIADVKNEIRERQTESMSSDVSVDEPNSVGLNDLHHDFHYHSTDGVFFVKFVVITTIILLIVMITSLVAYYHYRSASIADMKKQKYSSEWNKNVDLEAIKRFVLRHDAP